MGSKHKYQFKKKQSRYCHAGNKVEATPPTHTWPTMDGSGQRHAPAALYRPEERTSVPAEQEAGWASELFWLYRLEEKSCASAGDRTSPTGSSSV
jgi:hypothetical protein